MTGWLLVAMVRRAGVSIALVVAAAGVVWTAPTVAMTVGIGYPTHPLRGIGVPEMAGVVLAAALPALQVTAFSTFELLSCTRAAAVLTTYSALCLLLPPIPFLVWTVRIPMIVPETRLPSPWPFVGSLLLYGVIALAIHQVVGPLWGPILTIAGWLGLVLAQHWYGPSAVWGLFSTGRTWQTNWFALCALAGSVLAAAHRHRGVPMPLRRSG